MSSRERTLTAAVFLLDVSLVFAAWVGSYWLRFHALGLPVPRGVPRFEPYLGFAALLVPLTLIILRSRGLYRARRATPPHREMLRVAQAVALTAALAALASYAVRGELARSVLLLFCVLCTLTLCVSRLAVREVIRRLRRRGRFLSPVLVVGTGGPAEAFVRNVARMQDSGLVVRGLVSTSPARAGTLIEGVPVIGSVAELPGLAEGTGAEAVYLALTRAEHQAEQEALERLSDSTVAVRLVPDLARAFTLNVSVEDHDGTPVVLLTESPGRGWDGLIKHGFDAIVALAAILVLSPLLLVVALWVKLDSPGPVLYVQERVGLNGRRFRMLKFRTMRADAEAESGPAWPARGDPRRTRAGELLRRFSLDELPQLWNVLLGQMSLVGPRPERPVFVERFRASVPRYMLRHHVKAGMTGWAQINGLRGDTPLDRRIEYDLYYIRNWSLGFDLRILLLTLVRVLRDGSAA